MAKTRDRMQRKLRTVTSLTAGHGHVEKRPVSNSWHAFCSECHVCRTGVNKIQMSIMRRNRMKQRLIKTSVPSLLILAGIFVLVSCSEVPITGPTLPTLEPGLTEAIPASEMNFISWKPEVVRELRSGFNKIRGGTPGTATERIIAGIGGTVGGEETFGNKVYIPDDALAEDTDISVRVLFVDGDRQTGAGVEFLPSMKFEDDVYVTLSWAYLDLPGLDGLRDLVDEGGPILEACYQAHLDAKESGTQADADAAVVASHAAASHAAEIVEAIYRLADEVAASNFEDAASTAESIRGYGDAASDKAREAREYAQKAAEAAASGDVDGASDYTDKTHDAAEDVVQKGSDASEKAVEDVYNEVNIYYSEDGGNTWHPAESDVVDFDEKIVSLWVNHFTRFAWGF